MAWNYEVITPDEEAKTVARESERQLYKEKTLHSKYWLQVSNTVSLRKEATFQSFQPVSPRKYFQSKRQVHENNVGPVVVEYQRLNGFTLTYREKWLNFYN